MLQDGAVRSAHTCRMGGGAWPGAGSEGSSISRILAKLGSARAMLTLLVAASPRVPCEPLECSTGKVTPVKCLQRGWGHRGHGWELRHTSRGSGCQDLFWVCAQSVWSLSYSECKMPVADMQTLLSVK